MDTKESNKMPAIMFFESWWNAVDELGKADPKLFYSTMSAIFNSVFRNNCELVNEFDNIALKPFVSVILDTHKRAVEKTMLDRERNRARITRYRENKTVNLTDVTECNANVTDVTECNANVTDVTAYKKENKEKDKEENKEKDKKGVYPLNPPKARAFTPPTVEEVAEYCKTKGGDYAKVDAEQFVAFYASKGWKVGNQSMRDWKMALVTWAKRDRPSYQQTTTTGNPRDLGIMHMTEEERQKAREAVDW